jgi:hypothetical protein
MDSDSKLIALMLKDLERSHIPESFVSTLGIHTLTSEETRKWMGVKYDLPPSYEIPYFNSDGKPTGYARLRNLKQSQEFGPAKKKTKTKYLQKTNTAPHLYMPPIHDWNQYRNFDGKLELDRLVITEGEKKAICACMHDIPCVALGGVDAFMSGKRDILLLEEFDEFDLTATEIEICYDSDLNTNESVRKAMARLAKELNSRNPASICYTYIDAESAGNGKLGLDDFLIQFSSIEKAAKAYGKLKRKYDQLQDQMAVLGRELCYLKSAGKLYNIRDDRYYESGAALVLDYGPKFKTVVNGEKQPTVKIWLDERADDTDCEELVFEPGKPKRYRNKKMKGDTINLWRPISVRPKEGDIDLWLELAKYVLGSEEMLTWFMQWLAYPLQYPGTKLLQAVFVWSYANGVGKNFLIEPLVRKIYGKTYQVIKANELESDFTAWAKCKQFVFAEEIYMSDRRDRETTMGHLKSFITNEYITINAKYRPPETLKNVAQLYLTANQPNALAIDQADRRIAVIHAPEKSLSDAFYKKLHDWAHEPDSAGKLLNYLLHEVDVSQFNPRVAAPYTIDKEELLLEGRDTMQRYVAILADAPNVIFEVSGIMPDQHLFGTQELFTAINHYARENHLPELKISVDSLGRYLARAPIPSRRLHLSRNLKGRLYAIVDKKAWNHRSDEMWLAHYKKHSTQYVKPKEPKYAGGKEEKEDKE